jgi:hypothetical protein
MKNWLIEICKNFEAGLGLGKNGDELRMSDNDKVIRPRQAIKRALLKRVFNGESQVSLLEMWGRIQDAIKRGQAGGSPADVLDPIVTSLSAGQIRSWQDLELALAPTTSRSLRAYNIVAALEGSTQLVEADIALALHAAAPSQNFMQ